jgi:hypothetical protein
MGRLSDADLEAWVTASCDAQGVPVQITDAYVLAKVATLLTGGASRPSAGKRRPVAPTGSEAPHRLHSTSVEPAASGTGRSDHNVVDNGGDDGRLSGEVQSFPLGA